MKRGEIYFIKSTHREEGSEQRGDRPAVIVSNDLNNEHSDVVEVVYMTTKPKTDLPTHVFTRSALSPSTILCEQVNSISTRRIGTWIGELTQNELAAVDTALAISLGIDFGRVEVTREPTKEELDALLEKMKSEQPQLVQATQEEPDTRILKLETERDLYRQLYNELLGKLTKGATA